MIATVAVIDRVIKETIEWPSSHRWDSKDKDRRIQSFFGAPVHIIVDIWNHVWERKRGTI